MESHMASMDNADWDYKENLWDNSWRWVGENVWWEFGFTPSARDLQKNVGYTFYALIQKARYDGHLRAMA